MGLFEKDYLKIEGKTAIVTGAGRGIGRAIAVKLARYGVKVMLCDIQDEWMENAAEEIRGFGGICSWVHCDVSDSAQVKAAVREAADTFGTVDILGNDAGIGSVPIAFEEISDEAWKKMLKIDLYSAFYFTREVVPYMKKQRWGKIVCISSGSGVIGCEFCSHYATAKAAMIGFTESIAKELAPFHINANVIATPTTDTPQLAETDFDVFVEDEIKEIPWGRIGTPEDIADMVLYLSSDASEYVSGQILAPNGARRTPV